MTILSGIGSDQCGCDTAADPSLTTVDEARERLKAATKAIEGVESVPLTQARGRILAKPVAADGMVPPFDNAAMDGYAVDTTALGGDGPWRLPVVQRITAGMAPVGRIAGPIAARIFTGAPIPPGADAVVQQENTRREGDVVLLARCPPAGLNIRRAGSDMQPGQPILEPGRRMDERAIAACAAAGTARVQVLRRLRVALLVTGNEVRQAGAGAEPAGVHDVNTPMLATTLDRPEIDLVHIRHGLDDLAELTRTLADLARQTDLIVTTGGISVGEEDHVKPALEALAAGIVFSGVSLKPGKPVSLGRIGQTMWLGLPGNPLSAFVTWQLFGLPLLDALLGASGGTRRRRHVVIAQPIRRTPGRCELRPARLVGFDATGREVVTFEDTLNSAAMTYLPGADGLIVIPADTETLPEGALLEFQPFQQM